MTYVDGFLLPIPKGKIKEYQKMARKAGKIWMEHGALDFKECVGDDLRIPKLVSFVEASKAAKNDAVVFSFIVFKSRRHRDAVNKKVGNDPRIKKMSTASMPFDMQRMAYGGFKVIVDAK